MTAPTFAQLMDLDEITRIEIIDAMGRVYVRHGEVELQDHVLKIFVENDVNTLGDWK